MRKKVLVTRAAGQAEGFARQLEGAGLEALIFPVIEFAPPEDTKALSKAIRNIANYDWLVFTSSNSLHFFIEALHREGKKTTHISSLKVCAIGPKTAEAVRTAGLAIDLTPQHYQAEGVLKAFKEIDIKGKKILFPRAKEGREILPEGLTHMGAEVDLIAVYRTTRPCGREKELGKELEKGIDVITFTSGSTVRNFLHMIGEKKELIKSSKIACISEVTASIVRGLELEVDIIPEENTTESMVEAICRYFELNQ